MYEDFQPAAPDKIIALISAFREDPRPDKIDLGVGVFRDADGRTPVMRAVKAAEQRLLEGQETKAYIGLTGDPVFNDAMVRLALGPDAPLDRVRATQAPVTSMRQRTARWTSRTRTA